MESLFIPMVILTTVVWGVAIYFRSRFLLHMMQLEGYKNSNYLNWIKEFKHRVFYKKINLAFAIIVLITAARITLTSALDTYPIIWSLLMLLSVNFKKEKAKIELNYTQRAKRLMISSIIVNIILLLVAVAICVLTIKDTLIAYSVILLIATCIYYLEPYILCLGNIAVAPVEKKVNEYYFNMAKDKIRSFKDLKVVGITGSYGKTSVKFVTSTILEEKFNVLKTPESYNTPMGVSKVANGELNSEHEVFIVEMGARNIGDIKEMAELAGPKIGILTSIGPTHLETFKNIENIMKTKYELIEGLPSDGIAIFNYDNKHIKKLADKTFKEKILYGMEDIDKLDLYATDIEVSELGSTFILGDKEGNKVKCTTKLLGHHNISNILAGAALGKALGLTLEEISAGISKVEPVPHRLQLIVNPATGVIVIDDAFNSNPISSKAALEVLSQFKEGRKIIITPGMIELGDDEFKENKEFGKNIAKTCDYAILVGKNRTRPIQEGIKEEGFENESLFIVGSLDEATQTLQKIVRPKDIVLFENDLPDNYNE
ncbi:UDP-N-acetylmuramoyl-tripeptide--D-alanyl-D-alanine ligase MurF [Gottschalkia acidurici 9a]|uniref:UDP-N-acetylmuramoyl-tripeptide--D-alanyl-D-alanine ligase MurF n=1 Tax=Gottschalkia acidurici (strain ATCC 7906 / DSM 604 / BCRC 14475 / CIP 104303 / KCTC 5404 / NCIMB 10678 / 9a) TaxID=1128398 RepID=K0AW55_GOTA9|nr:UDP-N-acetylmuramoyl-tripeptide--D-alanyl-D-alanine ligase [Gottschalkia acidurici]AFS78108.1 UDP-N-acetylmuramoyl-tripeptide--D-alanyl-D-alanine ligase MurF [Gottschalkia acidurici 9a]